MRIQTRYLRGLLAALLVGVASPAIPASVSGDLRIVDAAQKQDKVAIPLLLRVGADVTATQADGSTALHWSVHWDDLETAELLMLFGADMNAKNDYGATPLSLACSNGNAAMVEKLVERGADPNLAAPSGETPLMRCARTGSAATVKALIAHKADTGAKDNEQGQTALMWAVAQKHADAAKALIDGGADIKARSRGGFTAMMFAARVGDSQSADVLLAAGANVNEAGPRNMTPLIMASASGQEAFAIHLLDKGADPNAKDEFGATALHYAVEKGITSLNGVRYANYVAYIFRPSLTELVKALLAHKADPNARLVRSPPLGGYAPAGGAAAGGQAAAGATPFLLAAASPDPEVMRLLVAAGADPKLGTNAKLTPVMVAAGLSRGQDYTTDEKRLAADAIRMTVELGGDVNAVNEDGLTALHGAAVNGADAVVQYLADKGAKLDVRDKYQQTPLSIATGIRLPWIPYGDELGEIIQPSTRDLLLKLGATPLETAGYFKPPTEYTGAFQFNQSQRYEGVTASEPGQVSPAPPPK
jgi:ankyrin repeat protein